MEENTEGRWQSLSVLTSVFIVGELSHFMISIVTRPMAQEIHYGTKECLVNPDSIQAPEHVNCYEANNSFSCQSLGSTVPGLDGNTTSWCIWNYSGLGLDYQILAGPVFIAVFTVSGIILGLFADRFNRKMLVTGFLLLLTLSTTLTGFATTFWHLVILRMLVGAGESVLFPACSSMLSDMFSQSRRGIALGIFDWGIYFGYGMSYAIGNFLTEANIMGMGWRWAYIVSGVAGFLVLILMALVVKEPERKSQRNAREISPPLLTQYYASSQDVKKAHHSFLSEKKGKETDSVSDRIIYSEGGLLQISKAILNPPVLMLTLGACFRHTAGFTWAYNTQLYFSTYYPGYNLGIWITAITITSGTMGVATGGFLADKFVKKIGLRARVYVLGASQFIATPFAIGVLTVEPPTAFFLLVGAYLFASMWFGVVVSVLLELLPAQIHSTSVAIFLFVINNVGGNAPVLIEPLRESLSYRSALLIMYPGLYFTSSMVFFLTSFMIPKKRRNVT